MPSRSADRARLETITATAGPQRVVLRAAAGPLRFTAVTPYRSVASTELAPFTRLPSGYFDLWDVWHDLNDDPQIPSTIRAVTYNLTVTQTVGAAFLAVIPAGDLYTGVSTINWMRSDVDLANNGTVGVGPDAQGFPGCIVVACGGVGAASHYILDITGYYV